MPSSDTAGMRTRQRVDGTDYNPAVPDMGRPPIRAWIVYPERKEKAGVVIVIHEILA